jgi:hypothetical protein
MIGATLNDRRRGIRSQPKRSSKHTSAKCRHRAIRLTINGKAGWAVAGADGLIGNEPEMNHGAMSKVRHLHWFLLAAIIAWALWMSARGEPRPEPPAPSPYDRRLIALDREALDAAYRNQLAKLFGVWMGDERNQPQRAMAGAARARRAYIAVKREIEERERRQ